MQKIPFGSPAKENSTKTVYPSPNRKKKGDPLAEILEFIKVRGLTLPPQLARAFGPSLSDSPLKEAAVNSREDAEVKKLRVQLSECQFQLKKTQEDFAEWKRQNKLEKEKEAKKSEEAISKLKNNLEITRQDSSYEKEQLTTTHRQQIQALKAKSNQELQQQVKGLKTEYQQKLVSQQKIRQRQVSELNKKWSAKVQERTREDEQKMSMVVNRHKEEIKQMSLRYKKQVDQREKRYDSTRVALQSQKQTEERVHQATKIEAAKEKQKLISELCYLNNIKSQLETDVEDRDKTIKGLKMQIKDLDVQLVLKEEKHAKKISEIEQQFEAKYQQYEEMQKEKIHQIKEKQIEQTNIFQERISQLHQLHQEKELLHQEAYEGLMNSFETRPSKKEDLNQIDQLKWSLTKKEEEIRRLQRDLKHCNLELENKEDIYKRMFRGNSLSREKRREKNEDKQQAAVEQKLSVGRQVLFRKSQTADIKYLLKFYHNRG